MNKASYYSLMTATSLFAVSANAATVSYILTEGDGSVGPGEYVSVMLEDSMSNPGSVDISVSQLEDISVGENPGIVAFGFNLLNVPGEEGKAPNPDAVMITGLPDNWTKRYDYPMSEFGNFGFVVKGIDYDREETLTFSVAGMTTADFGTGFAASVQGDPADSNSFMTVTYGNAKPVDGGTPPIPLPAAAWLMMSGLVGVVGVARRRAVAIR